MYRDPLAQAAVLLRERNAIDAELAQLIDRPMTSAHLGEWIAAQVSASKAQVSASNWNHLLSRQESMAASALARCEAGL